MYFPFLELRKWCKRSAEIRRRNCAVLPQLSASIKACLFFSRSGTSTDIPEILS